MKRAFVEAWLLLFYFDWLMRFRDFEAVHGVVRKQSLRESRRCSTTAAGLCREIDLACVFYFKRVLCLQRSAATAVLLRRHGWMAEMVIGVQMLPFQSHAWVEVDGRIVNDKPYVRDRFEVLERC
jgi:hypothetical protein